MNQLYRKINLETKDLAKICTSRHWQQLMTLTMPFDNSNEFLTAAQNAFTQLEEDDWLEAFSGHPMIGDLKTLKAKFGQGKALSEKEQSQVQDAPDDVLEELLKLNLTYQEKFGFIFIVCATNKSAQEILKQLKQRIHRSRQEELVQAAIEQTKISRIRMEAYLCLN